MIALMFCESSEDSLWRLNKSKQVSERASRKCTTNWSEKFYCFGMIRTRNLIDTRSINLEKIQSCNWNEFESLNFESLLSRTPVSVRVCSQYISPPPLNETLENPSLIYISIYSHPRHAID